MKSEEEIRKRIDEYYKMPIELKLEARNIGIIDTLRYVLNEQKGAEYEIYKGLCHQENGFNEEFGISMTEDIFCKDNPTYYYKQLQVERQELEQLRADYKYSQDELRASKNSKKLYENRVSELFRENTALKEQLEEQIENGINLVMDSRKQENIIKTKLDFVQNNLNTAVEALEWLKELLQENYNDEENRIICVSFAYEKILEALQKIKGENNV